MRASTEEELERFNRVFVGENLWKDDEEKTAFVDIKRILRFIVETRENAYYEGVANAKNAATQAIEKAFSKLTENV